MSAEESYKNIDMPTYLMYFILEYPLKQGYLQIDF